MAREGQERGNPQKGNTKPTVCKKKKKKSLADYLAVLPCAQGERLQKAQEKISHGKAGKSNRRFQQQRSSEETKFAIRVLLT